MWCPATNMFIAVGETLLLLSHQFFDRWQLAPLLGWLSVLGLNCGSCLLLSSVLARPLPKGTVPFGLLMCPSWSGLKARCHSPDWLWLLFATTWNTRLHKVSQWYESHYAPYKFLCFWALKFPYYLTGADLGGGGATPGLASSARNTVRCLNPNGLGTRPRSSITLRVRTYYVRERNFSKEEAHGGPGTCNPRTSGNLQCKARRCHESPSWEVKNEGENFFPRFGRTDRRYAPLCTASGSV